MVLWCSRPNRTRAHRSSECGFLSGRYDHWLTRWTSLCSRWILCRDSRYCGASAHQRLIVHVLGCPSSHVYGDSQRDFESAAVEPRNPAPVPREHQGYEGATGSPERLGHVHKPPGEPCHAPSVQARGCAVEAAELRRPGETVLRLRRGGMFLEGAPA